MLFGVALPGDGTHAATYGYLANSRQIEHITFHNGTADVMRTSKQWDLLDRLGSISHQRLIGDQATISSYRYRYNLANQRYRVDEADGSYWVYGYDDLGQLVGGVKHAADDPPLPRYAFGYGYDDDGQPSEARQQASPTLSEARPNVQLPMTGDGRWTYTWNGENRLIAMETAATAVAAGAPKQKLAFAYDHQTSVVYPRGSVELNAHS